MIEPLESRVLLSAGPAVSSIAATQNNAAVTMAATPAATSAGAVTGVQLGGNLQQQTAQNPDHAYVDLIKATTFTSLKRGSVSKDANGWPTADFGVVVWGSGTVDTGVYNVSFTGPASTIMANFSTPAKGARAPAIKKIGFNATTHVNTYTVTVPAGVTLLEFKFTNTGGQVKNLHVLQPGYKLANYPVFTNKYVNFLKGLHPYDLRFMDFTNTNFSPVSSWSSRTVPATASFVARGAPWEDVILLANQVHTNLWINVPFHATDDYVKQLATLIKNTLDPKLNVYIEFSNEVWNTAFEQGASNVRAALAEVQAGVRSGHHSNLNYDNQPVNLKQTNPNTGEVVTWADRATARRLMQISNIFKSVWASAGLGNPIDTRVRPILSGQGPVLSRFTNMLSYINKVYGAPKKFFYGIGIAPYWGLNLYQDQQNASGKWTTLNQHITEAQALDGMSRSIAHYGAQKVFSSTLAYGAKYGLKLEAYEGGEDTHGPFNIQAKKAATLNPAISAMMARYLNTWYSQGGDVLDWYRLGAGSYNTQYGTFGITDNINNLNEPKEREFRTYRGFSANG